ncbi:MAG: DUF3159 domain-containing protein [Ruaniaceae bacterium]|nr:DUF3159 domain-containing protein [Ruaniaceae bacterium]
MTEEQRGARQIVAEDFNAMAAMGGVRGIVESVLPAVVFVVAYVSSQSLPVALVISLVVVAGLVIARLVQRGSLVQSLTGFGGVLIGLVWAALSGEARDYFAWGIVVNALYLAGCLISILVRRPLVGLLVQVFTGTSQKDSPMRSRHVAATWLWVGVFAARLLAQVPLYQAGDVAWLGTVRIAMGVPLFAVAAFFTWLMIREPSQDDVPADESGEG